MSAYYSAVTYKIRTMRKRAAVQAEERERIKAEKKANGEDSEEEIPVSNNGGGGIFDFIGIKLW